jgi:hypothetical protein
LGIKASEKGEIAMWKRVGLLALCLSTLGSAVLPVPALAQDGYYRRYDDRNNRYFDRHDRRDWQNRRWDRDWREREWREQRWREREWRRQQFRQQRHWDWRYRRDPYFYFGYR